MRYLCYSHLNILRFWTLLIVILVGKLSDFTYGRGHRVQLKMFLIFFLGRALCEKISSKKGSSGEKRISKKIWLQHPTIFFFFNTDEFIETFDDKIETGT